MRLDDLRLDGRTPMLIGAGIALIGVLTGGAMAWSAWGPVRAPDALEDPLEGVLDFALLDARFNRLPIEERVRLALDLARRLQSMSAGDSALLAAFAAGLRGAARAQLEDNVRTLGVDLMTDYGDKYASVPEGEREEFLDRTAVEWQRIMEELTGEQREVSDEERLAEMREQAEQDAERGRRNAPPLTPERVTNFFESIREDVGDRANPNQRAQTARFIRDMTRHLRGRDIATNKPLK